MGSQQLQSETLHQEEPGMGTPVLSPPPPHPVGPGWAGARALRELSPQIWRLPTSLGSPASAPGRVGALCLPLDGRTGRHLGGHDSVPTTVQVRKLSGWAKAIKTRRHVNLSSSCYGLGSVLNIISIHCLNKGKVINVSTLEVRK